MISYDNYDTYKLSKLDEVAIDEIMKSRNMCSDKHKYSPTHSFDGGAGELRIGQILELPFREMLTSQDFIYKGRSLNVKTKKYKGVPLLDFVVDLAEHQVHKRSGIDYLVFCYYNPRSKVVTTLGYMGEEEFISKSESWRAGQIRTDHNFNCLIKGDCRIMPIYKLHPISEMLRWQE